MGKWRWDGFSKDGKKISGLQEAKDERDLKKILRSQGVRPVRITPPSILETDLGQFLVEKGLARPFGRTELMNFTKQLSIMINSGVPILQGLEILFKQERNPSMKIAIKKISEDVGSGSTLSDAMVKHKGFDRLYCNLVKAGETGGILDKILDKIAKYMDKEAKIRSQVKSALTYPTIVIFVGIIVIYVMLAFVVPKFAEMLTEGGQQLPDITQFVLDVSKFLNENILFISIGVPVSIMFFNYWRKSEDGKPVWDQMVMKIPLFGELIIKGNLSSFTRTLSTMLSSGVSLVDSLEICIDTIDNTVIAKDIRNVRKLITQGKTLAEPLNNIPYFPSLVSQMIKIGESTGNLDEMLEKIANLFEEEVNNVINTMSKMIEPLILVGLGGVVGVILVAMYLPIFMSAGGNSD